MEDGIVGVIYMISNSKNRKVYVGQTIRGLERRFNDHLKPSSGSIISNAIRKYGKYNFTISEIDRAYSLEELNAKEEYWVDYYDSMSPNGYNLRSGGMQPGMSDETRQKLRDARKRLFESGYITANKGKTLEELVGDERAVEIKARCGKTISEGIKSGRIRHNKGKSIEDIVGEDRAIEIRAISSDTAKRTFTGRKQSEEQKRKRREAQIKTIRSRSPEEQERINKIKSETAKACAKHFEFKINDTYSFTGTWNELADAILKDLGMRCCSSSLSAFYRGKTKSMKCDIFKIRVKPIARQ